MLDTKIFAMNYMLEEIKLTLTELFIIHCVKFYRNRNFVIRNIIMSCYYIRIQNKLIFYLKMFLRY